MTRVGWSSVRCVDITSQQRLITTSDLSFATVIVLKLYGNYLTQERQLSKTHWSSATWVLSIFLRQVCGNCEYCARWQKQSLPTSCRIWTFQQAGGKLLPYAATGQHSVYRYFSTPGALVIYRFKWVISLHCILFCVSLSWQNITGYTTNQHTETDAMPIC